MQDLDYDDPIIESKWIAQQHKIILEYLESQKIKHRGVPDQPDWFLAPYVSIWRVMSMKYEGSIGWWAIAGDLPTDYISSTDARDVRQAMRKFSSYWIETSEYMLKGKQPPNVIIGKPEDWPMLGDLLSRRADILLKWADDDESWESG